MENATVSYLRQCNPSKDATPYGRTTDKQVLYIHSWKTGSQELIFNSEEDARKFAEAEGAKYDGPK